MWPRLWKALVFVVVPAAIVLAVLYVIYRFIDRERNGQSTHVLAHEVVLCEDNQTCMVYLYFGFPGDDARDADISDIAAIYYDLDKPVSDFDCEAAAACFVGLVEAINERTAFRVY
jgi:hypothetical protein